MGYERSSQRKNVLLLLSDIPEDQQFAAGVISNLKAELKQPKTRSEFLESFANADQPIILVDIGSPQSYRLFFDSIGELKQRCPHKINGNNTHFIHSTETMKLPDPLEKVPSFGSFICRRFKDPHAEGIRYAYLINTAFCQSEFSLQRMFSPNIQVEKITITFSSQKQNILNRLKALATAGNFPDRATNTIITAVDEIIMNAIYDAHEDEEPGRSILPRSTEIKLEGKREVETEIAYDGQVLGISVMDHVGSLKKDKLLRHLLQDFTKDNYQVEQKTHRAGLGVGSIFRMGGSLLFVCQPKTKTYVSVFFRKTESFRDFRLQFKHVSIIMDERT